MLLKLILNALLAFVLFRLVRALWRPPKRKSVGSQPRRSLDPDQAVSADWTEVRDQEGGGDR